MVTPPFSIHGLCNPIACNVGLHTGVNIHQYVSFKWQYDNFCHTVYNMLDYSHVLYTLRTTPSEAVTYTDKRTHLNTFNAHIYQLEKNLEKCKIFHNFCYYRINQTQHVYLQCIPTLSSYCLWHKCQRPMSCENSSLTLNSKATDVSISS